MLVRTSQLESGALTRLVWSEIVADSITWNYDRRTPAGAWESTWRILYTRKDSQASPPPI